MTPDLLTLIRRACEGTPAEGLAPHLDGSVPYCRNDCPHYRDSTSCAARSGLIVEDVCEPAAEALARLAVEGAAEVERLRAMLPARWVVELQPGCWLAPWDGDPGRTLVLGTACTFIQEDHATHALAYARTFRPFPNAAVRLLEPTP